MRIHRMRFDIWLTLLLAFLIGLGAAKIGSLFLPALYEKHVEEHTVADGSVGGKAGEDVYRAQSVDDLLSHDTFTIVSHGIEYRNKADGFYNTFFMYAVTLPSGEIVAARINMDSVQYGEDYYASDHILPVGRVVYENLEENEDFLHQIEYREPLSRHDFYVDMRGESGGRRTEEDFYKSCTDTIQVVVTIVCFPLIHSLGSKLGIFPAFFAPRRKKDEEEPKSEWD